MEEQGFHEPGRNEMPDCLLGGTTARACTGQLFVNILRTPAHRRVTDNVSWSELSG